MKTRFVKEKLKELGKDPEWLAAKCGVSPITMKTNILRGIKPRLPTLMLMAQALKCSVKDLVYEDETATEESRVS